MRRLAPLVLSLVLVATVLAGVSLYLTARDDDGSHRSAASDSSVQASLKKFRSREADRYALLVLRNTGDRPVTVERAQLRSPDLEQRPGFDVDTTLEPGARVDVPFRYGAARCHGGDGAGAGREVRLSASIRVGDQPAEPVEIAMASPEPLVELIARTDCQRSVLDAAVDIGWGRHWTTSADGKLVRGDLVLRRRDSDEAISLSEINSSVVFSVRPQHPVDGGRPGRALVRLAPGRDTAELPLRFHLPSCSPHLLIEAKKAYIFPIRASVGAAEAVATPLTAEGPAHAALARLLQQRCAPG